MRFLTNITKPRFREILSENLENYEQAFLSVGLIEQSAFDALRPSMASHLKTEGQLIVLAGQHTGLTHAKTLLELKRLMDPYPESRLYLSKDASGTARSHPNLFLFRSLQKCCIMSGPGGLSGSDPGGNLQAALMVKCNESDPVWLDAIAFFEQSIAPGRTHEGSLLLIRQYETYHERSKRAWLNVEPPYQGTESHWGYEQGGKLREHFDGFNNKQRHKAHQQKLQDYARAKDLIDRMAGDKDLTKPRFESLLDGLLGNDQPGLWHMPGLKAQRSSICRRYKAFAKLADYVRRQQSSPAATVYRGAMERAAEIEGVGQALLTALMITCNPTGFAWLGSIPVQVLRHEAGVHLKGEPTSFNPEDYGEYCLLIKEITTRLGLRDMLEAGSFFEYIHQKTAG